MAKILIVDDDPDLRTALRRRLEKEDHSVLTAENGMDGMDVAEREVPELIVLDLVMPGVDGLELLDRLRRNVTTWEIPVVVLTAREDCEAREKSHRLGVTRFFKKPFSPRRLVSEIRQLLPQIGI